MGKGVLPRGLSARGHGENNTTHLVGRCWSGVNKQARKSKLGTSDLTRVTEGSADFDLATVITVTLSLKIECYKLTRWRVMSRTFSNSRNNLRKKWINSSRIY